MLPGDFAAIAKIADIDTIGTETFIVCSVMRRLGTLVSFADYEQNLDSYANVYLTRRL